MTSYTENGDIALATSGSACLDFFTQIVRGADVEATLISFQKAYLEDKECCIKILLNMRDARTGKGEKLLPIVIMAALGLTVNGQFYEDLCRELVSYGCWKDLLRIREIYQRTMLENDKSQTWTNQVELRLFAEQLEHDWNCIQDEDLSVYNSETYKPVAISLCAKWAPSEDTHFDHHPMKFTKSLASIMNLSLKDYRIRISRLRKHLNILERLMSTGQYESIDFSKIPSAAIRKHRNAFMRDSNAAGEESDERKELHCSYKKYLEELSCNKKKVNVAGTHPHELVGHYYSDGEFDQLIESQWEALMDRIKQTGVFRNVTAVVDVSGSMEGVPMLVSISLGLLVASLTEGAFHGQVITFHTNPSWFRVAGATLKEKVRYLKNAPWGQSTNLRKVFELILQQAREANLTQEEMIKTLFIFTDMQFDQAAGSPLESTFEFAKRAYHEAGYELPNVICWNLRSSVAKTMPVSKNEEGFAMLSGFSSELLKCILTGSEYTPLKMMKHALEPYSAPESLAQTSNQLVFPFEMQHLVTAIEKSTIKKSFKKSDQSDTDSCLEHDRLAPPYDWPTQPFDPLIAYD